MIPFLCPELPEKQKQALHYLVKVPLVYTSVGIRNWTSFQKLGVSNVSAPGAYWLNVSPNPVVNIGQYRSSASPKRPDIAASFANSVQAGAAAAGAAEGRDDMSC